MIIIYIYLCIRTLNGFLRGHTLAEIFSPSDETAIRHSVVLESGYAKTPMFLHRRIFYLQKGNAHRIVKFLEAGMNEK